VDISKTAASYISKTDQVYERGQEMREWLKTRLVGFCLRYQDKMVMMSTDKASGPTGRPIPMGLSFLISRFGVGATEPNITLAQHDKV